MSRKGSIAPAPITSVINIHTLNQALHPGSQPGDDSRSTSPGIDPLETRFLAEFDNLSFSHNMKEECCTCPWKAILELQTPDKNLVMKGFQHLGCLVCSNENIEIFNTLTNELVILIEFLGGGCWSFPNKIQVYGPPGFSVGFIERIETWCSTPTFEIKNPASDIIYTVKPEMKLCGPCQFPIMSTDGNLKIGEVTSGGPCSYTLNYTERLHPSIKALLIGFTFYLDVIDRRRMAMRNAAISG